MGNSALRRPVLPLSGTVLGWPPRGSSSLLQGAKRAGEEDERVFVHPRNPYVRVDALRSSRNVRIELEGVVLGESSSPTMVFETGLPTRYYLNRTEIEFDHLIATDTVTECPYKGTTAGYWSVQLGDQICRDAAWTYGFPTRELLPIAGLIAFYNEKVDIFVDGDKLDRPKTHFVRSSS